MSKSSKSGKPKGGRPTLFTPENCEKILQGIRLGSPDMIAPLAAGVQYATFRLWVQRGEREGQGPFFEFAEALQKAKGDRVSRWLAIVEKAAVTTWTAAAWKLERLHPEFFSIKQRVEHTAKDGAPLPAHETHIHLNLGKLADEELSLVERLAQRGAIVKPPVGSNGNGNGHAPEDAGAAD